MLGFRVSRNFATHSSSVSAAHQTAFVCVACLAPSVRLHAPDDGADGAAVDVDGSGMFVCSMLLRRRG
jgi:hypothetical protein